MASIWLARNISRTMTTRPHPKWAWNIFLAGLSVVLLLVFGYIVYQILGEYICFETKQVYVSYDGSNVITTTNAYLVSNDEYTQVNIINDFANFGDEIVIIVSSLSGKVMEIFCDGLLIYQISKASPTIAIIALIFFIIMLSFLCFMFYIVNTKKPKKFIYKIQRKILL